MIVGIPRETKEGEARVALGPREVAALVAQGNQVRVQAGSGESIGIPDASWTEAGARVVSGAIIWRSPLVVKVKELQQAELEALPSGGTIFSFHHLLGAPERTRALAARQVTALAFEAVRDSEGYPLLAPMSAIAGAMAVEMGVKHAWQGAASHVLVLGAGKAGMAAAHEAKARGLPVSVLTRSEASRDRAKAAGFPAGLASAQNVERFTLEADIVIGAAYVPGEPTPKLLPRSLVKRMKMGAVIVDVSIEEGGVAETSRPTTHAEPTYVEEGVAHYAVGNMPAAQPARASEALAQALLPYVQRLATSGIARALRDDASLRAGALLWKGRVNHAAIAAEAGLPYTALSEEDLA
jgi:alanine dehydrogenase